MKPMTIQDVLNLPAAYDIPADVAEYADYYGPSMQQPYIQAYVSFQYNSYYVANVFNYVLWGSVAFMVLIAGFGHYVLPHLPRPRALSTFRTLWTKHMMLSSTAGSRSTEPLAPFRSRWGTFQVPLRIHGLVVGVYVALNFIILFTPYSIVIPNLYWQDIGYPWDQYLRYFSDRTGIISFGGTPLVIVLASRNNPIAYLTGASYSTLQIYHRWVARVVATHALLHGLGYTLIEVLYSAEAFKECFSEAYWNWGCAALGGGAILLLLSLRRLRELAYEVFLIGHILGAILWIVACYYHVWLLDPNYSFLKWIYASVGFWAADRLFRLARMLFLNLPFRGRQPASVKSSLLAAEGILHESGAFIRLRVTPATPWPSKLGGPGTYVFISSPTSNIWENHPFTITWPLHMPPSDASEALSASPSRSASSISDKEEHNVPASSNFIGESDRSFELLLRPYAGFTSRLAKSLQLPLDPEAGKVVKAKGIKLLVEGPYGTGQRLRHYESVILVAGGSGVSATIAHLADVGKQAREGSLRVQRICVVWAIRDLESARVLIPYLQRLSCYLSNATLQLSLQLYHTGDDIHPESWVDTVFKTVAHFVTVSVISGRPVVVDHITAWRQYATSRIVVSVCGPSGLCDVTREAVKASMGGKQGFSADELSFEEEAFTW